LNNLKGFSKPNRVLGKLMIAALLALALPGFAADYGAAVNQQLDGRDGDHTYTGTLVPWLSVPLGERADLYFSAGYRLDYDGEDWLSLPALYRFSFQFRPYPDFFLETGRLPYQDIRGAVASGLFDGLSLSFRPGGVGRLAARLLFTGLLYKKDADILMTSGDWAAYAEKVSYENGGDFYDTYFASRRMMGAVSWELPDIIAPGNSLAFEGMGQVDLNDREDLLHSAYASVRFNWFPQADLGLDLGGTMALVTQTDADPACALSFLGKLDWDPPGGLWDRAALLVRYTSEKAGDALASFPAVTTLSPGYVLRGIPAGLAVIQGSYRALLYQALSGELGAAYFFKTGDTAGTGAFDTEVSHPDSPFLGGELRASFMWVPFSDLSLSLDCGLFIPQWGAYFASDASLPWRISGGLVFSF
jgi:hypothetical protein